MTNDFSKPRERLAATPRSVRAEAVDLGAAAAGPTLGAALGRRAPIILTSRGGKGSILNTTNHLRGLLAHPMPVTGVLAGTAKGEDAILFLACDGILMAPKSALLLSPSGRGEAALLSLRLGHAAASRVWFGGGRLSAREAEKAGWGSIARGGFDDALESAQGRFEGLSPRALALLRPLLLHESGMPAGPARVLERAAFALAFETGDPGEGIAAFLEKRKPKF